MAHPPIGLGHFFAIRFNPVEIFDVDPVNRPAEEKMPPAKHRLSPAQAQQRASEIEQLTRCSPDNSQSSQRNRGILTVDIVIPMLGLSELIPRQKHRNTLGKNESGEKVAPLLSAQVS